MSEEIPNILHVEIPQGSQIYPQCNRCGEVSITQKGIHPTDNSVYIGKGYLRRPPTIDFNTGQATTTPIRDSSNLVDWNVWKDINACAAYFNVKPAGITTAVLEENVIMLIRSNSHVEYWSIELVPTHSQRVAKITTIFVDLFKNAVLDPRYLEDNKLIKWLPNETIWDILRAVEEGADPNISEDSDVEQDTWEVDKDNRLGFQNHQVSTARSIIQNNPRGEPRIRKRKRTLDSNLLAWVLK